MYWDAWYGAETIALVINTVRRLFVTLTGGRVCVFEFRVTLCVFTAQLQR